MHRDAPQVDESELRFLLPADDVVANAVLVDDPLGRSVGRHGFRLFLLEETLPGEPVRAALERDQAVLHPRLQLRKDEVVETHQVELRVALVRPEDLVEIDQLQPPAVVGFEEPVGAVLLDGKFLRHVDGECRA